MLPVVLYGAGFIFVLGLVPAFVICLRRGGRAMVVLGLLTLGIGWWVGALRGRQPRSLAIVAAVLCVILVAGVVWARPVRFFGVDAGSLERSVAGLVAIEGKPCRHLSGADWVCGRHAHGSGEDVVYRVHVDSLGCWQGVLVETFRNGDPSAISGCVHLQDYL